MRFLYTSNIAFPQEACPNVTKLLHANWLGNKWYRLLAIIQVSIWGSIQKTMCTHNVSGFNLNQKGLGNYIYTFNGVRKAYVFPLLLCDSGSLMTSCIHGIFSHTHSPLLFCGSGCLMIFCIYCYMFTGSNIKATGCDT